MCSKKKTYLWIYLISSYINIEPTWCRLTYTITSILIIMTKRLNWIDNYIHNSQQNVMKTCTCTCDNWDFYRI